MSTAQKTVVGIMGFGIVIAMVTAIVMPKWSFEQVGLFSISTMMLPAAIAVFVALEK
jgi:phosphate/sulfate permease